MKVFKNIFTVTLCLILTLSLIPLTKVAADEEVVSVYFENDESNWEVVVAIYEDEQGELHSIGELSLDGINDTMYVAKVALGGKIRFQNYLPGQPEEAAPVEGFQSTQFFPVESGRIYRYSATNASEFNVWIGGVAVNEENSEDVLGDGTVTFDAETGTLTLNGADIEGGYKYLEDCVAGIYSFGDINIVLEGEESNILSTECLESYGIYVEGNLSISGNGVLKVTGGSYFSEDASVYSTGIFVEGLLSVNEATVIANGGEVTSGERYEASSEGVIVEGSLLIDSKGSLTANGGNVNGGEYAFSYGIVVYSADDNAGRIEIYDGTLNANSSTAKSTLESESIGVLINECYFYSYELTSRINIKSGDAIAISEEGYAASAGIYAMGEVNFQDGKINISTGVSDEGLNNVGIVVGWGDVVIDSGEDGLGLELSITTTNGMAFFTNNEISIGEGVIVTNPEEYSVGEMTDMVDVWTIFDKDGNAAKDVTVRSKKLLGDINEDGNINAQDALLALQHSAKIIELNESQRLVGNVNFDENINASDALEILKYAADIIDSF